ncbi:MAG: SprB repeat-containing protein, partial [Catalinimonas sp.]
PSADLTPVSGCGTNDGSITVFVTGGSGNYQYQLSDGTINTNGSFTGLGAGVYTVTITDLTSGCQVTVTDLSLGAVNAPMASVVTRDESSCVGSSGDGQISLQVQGGLEPYQYALDAGAGFGPLGDANVFGNLTAGTYGVVVVDANGCTDTLRSVVVGAGAPRFTINPAVVSNVTTCDGTDGRIVPTVTGAGPFSYQWLDLTDTMRVRTGLAAGTYQLTVTQIATGCTQNVTYTVLEPSDCGGSGGDGCFSFTLIDRKPPTACSDLNDGIITFVVVEDAAQPVSYSIDGGITFGPDSIYAGLAPGTYDVIVRDANDCQKQWRVELERAGSFAYAAEVLTDVRCAGDSSGAVIVSTLADGSGTYLYGLNGLGNLQPIQAGDTIAGLPAGEHTLYLIDANNEACVQDTLITITEPAVLTVAAAQTQPSQCTAPTGRAALTSVVGGSGNYRYFLNDEPVNVSTAPANAGLFLMMNTTTPVSLAAGTHTLVVLDGNGCSVRTEFEVAADVPVVNQAIQIDPTCFGAEDGQLRLMDVTGGVAPYTYSLNGGSFSDSTAFGGLAGGVAYNVRIRDAAGCIVTYAYTLQAPTPIGFETEVRAPATCALND